MRTEPARKVRLTTANVLLAELLKPFLEERHGIELCCVSELAEVGDASLVLVDLGSVPEAALERWLEGLVPAVTVAFLNATVEQALPWVERFPAIQGVFAPQASREQLLQGLGALLAGEDWLPRSILAHLLRRSRERPSIAADGLTRREREILRLVGRGLSNAAIGQALCLSTHTVKSHMHNLLRKTGAANRAEAALRFHAGQDLP
ncbi:helix-turn-helix transcriptional regulator [Pseudomonas oryzihabitans]|uniref:helix-turn-helix transcriptional regulator n=1 Tax=Pseudomonas oryzihabitans TaxID=47885 RepID=UPI00285EBF4C|nr:LuxR C-terminal-related transcriptional regulator [Pseudomonas psychrotolerans]MDR6676699.1 DNA-binding NarL/FixJ family response regulator [Pseudomonas psychrotolerans]